MTLLKFYFLTVVGVCLLLSLVQCIRHDVREMMYKTFDGAPACFRRLNGTHQFGCSSSRGGNYGVVHFIKDDSNLVEFLQNAVAGPYVTVLTPDMFRRDVVDSLINSLKVSGIVLNTALLPDIDPLPKSFSPDDDCPNQYSGVENNCSIPWNPVANKFLLYDWPLPVFLVNSLDHYKAIADCHNKFNPPLDESQLSRPLCSLHLNSHMFAAVDSETCLRRINYYGVNTQTYCDPLGDENIVLPSVPWDETKSKNVVIVGARMDTLSMFNGIAPGAMSAVTGLVSLLTTAFIYHKMISTEDLLKNNQVGVMFILFNGEANDYIGSSRAVYDMENNLFPSRNKMSMNKLSMKNVRLFIELSQLSSTNKVFVHHTSDKEVNDFMDYLNKTGKDVVFEGSQEKEFPPASFQSFYKANKNISGAILTNFDREFANTFYHSVYDNSKYLGFVYGNGSVDKSAVYNLQNRLTSISYSVASYLYKITTSKEPSPMDQQYVTLVDELLHCYIETRKCRLMREVETIESGKVPDLLPLYVGVKKSPENYITTITGFILAYLTGKKLPKSKENCINSENQIDYSYIWMNNECINSSVLFTPAESPAFIISDYDWKSGQYSTWTESVWDANTLRIFVKPYRIQEFTVLTTGLMVFVLSFISVYWFNKRTDILFVPVSPTSC